MNATATATHPYEEIVSRAVSDTGTKGAVTITLRLKRGESAWNPVRTDRLIYGPCKVTYIRHQDGGWEGHIE